MYRLRDRVCMSTVQKLDLPVLLNLNARSLCSEKIDELHVIVSIYDVSFVCVTETWFTEYMGNDSAGLTTD